MAVYINSCGQVTFFTTREFSVCTLLDFNGRLILGDSLMSVSESDSSSEVLMVRIGVLQGLLFIIAMASSDSLATAVWQACGDDIAVQLSRVAALG